MPYSIICWQNIKNYKEVNYVGRRRGYSAGSTLLAFFLGGLVGAGVALLLAPKSGPETRKIIKEYAGEAKGESRRLSGQV